MLHEAARRRSIRAATLLLGLGAHVDPVDAAGRTPLHYALAGPAQEDFAQAIRRALALLLIDRSAASSAETAVVGWAPLHLASWRCRGLAGRWCGRQRDNDGRRLDPGLRGGTKQALDRRTRATCSRSVSRSAGEAQPFPLHLNGYGDRRFWGRTNDPNVAFAMPDRQS